MKNEENELEQEIQTEHVGEADWNQLPHYVGGIHPNCDYHHGQIPPLKGVHCYQITRANRRHPELADGTTSTYKHAPCLAWFAGRFYVQYLCNPVDEHTGAGYSVLVSSVDGKEWGDYQISFPPYPVKKAEEPDFSVTDYKGLTHSFTGEVWAFMHQRMSFYRSHSGRMLLCGFYGWSPEKWMTNWDNYGIGRVVRELHEDGSLGEIYFILPNAQSGFDRSSLRYPLYEQCPDVGFVEACRELLGNTLMIQQWAEENGDRIPGLVVPHPAGGTYQAFCWYHRSEKEIIGLWKHSLAAVSYDGGAHFSEPRRVPSLVMSGQKVWAQRTPDGRYAMVYDPTLESEHRYPLCVTFSEDGLSYSDMRLVHGEVPPRRYAGFWKDFGPQYMRGILRENLPEGDDLPELLRNAMYVVYSVNKEDIWIARIPIPAKDEEETVLEDDFAEGTEVLDRWNLYGPVWACPGLVQTSKGSALCIRDREPLDDCLAERVVRQTKKLHIALRMEAECVGREGLYLELCAPDGKAGIRLILRDGGILRCRTVAEMTVGHYPMGEPFTLEIDADCEQLTCKIRINGECLPSGGKDGHWNFLAAVETLSRVVLRSGPARWWPTLDTEPDGEQDVVGEHEMPLDRETGCRIYWFQAREWI